MVLILSKGCYFLHSYRESVSEWAEVDGAMPISEITLFCSCLCLCLPLVCATAGCCCLFPLQSSPHFKARSPTRVQPGNTRLREQKRVFMVQPKAEKTNSRNIAMPGPCANWLLLMLPSGPRALSASVRNMRHTCWKTQISGLLGRWFPQKSAYLKSPIPSPQPCPSSYRSFLLAAF